MPPLGPVVEGRVGAMAVRAALLFLFFAFALQFLRTIPYAPLLNFDDALANVSVTLSRLQRLGFLIIPHVQPGGVSEVMMTSGYFGYGPWYFAIGAAFDRLFGTSYETQRAVYLFGVLAICVAGFWTLRRANALAAMGFVAAYLWLVANVQWPMARPDVAAAAFGALAVAACVRAISRDGVAWWLAVGLGVGLAVTQHPITGPLAIWALTMWGLDAVLARREGARARRAAAKFALLALGGLVPALVYVWASHWRIDVILRFYLGYADYAELLYTDATWFIAFQRHFNLAWAGWARPMKAVVLAGGLVGAAVLLAAWRGKDARGAVGLLAPPLAAAVILQVLLGFAKNTVLVYVILPQALWVWSGAALTAVCLHRARARFALWGAVDRAATPWLASILACAAAVGLWMAPGPLTIFARQIPGYGDYIARVVAGIPEGSSAWGSAVFGLSTGRPLDLVEFIYGRDLAETFAPEARAELAPDFLVYGEYYNQFYALSGVSQRNADSPFELFPAVRYALARIVAAPGYGTTRVYARDADPDVPPRVAAVDGRGAPWKDALGAPLAVATAPSDAMRVTLAEPANRGDAVAAWVVDLPAGTYLLSAQGLVGVPGRYGVLIAAAGATVTTFDQILDLHQYSAYATRGHLLVRHRGGALHLGQFDDRASPLEWTVRPVVGVEAEPAFAPIPVPAPAGWNAVPGVAALDAAPGVFAFNSDGSQHGYQLVSPPIPVPADTRLRLAFAIEAASNGYGLGVLDESGRWMAPPIRGGTLVFDSRGNRNVTLVLTAMHAIAPAGPERVALGAPTLARALRPPGRYVDTLAACRIARSGEAFRHAPGALAGAPFDPLRHCVDGAPRR